MDDGEQTPTLIDNAEVHRRILAHLGPEKASAFQALRTRCLEQGLLNKLPQLAHSGLYDGITDECTLLRFLRARQFNVEEAFKQFNNACTVRNANELLSAYDTFEVKDYEHCRQLYPSWSGRRDKHGLPICCFDISKLDAAAMATYKKSHTLESRDLTASGRASPQSLRALAFHESLTRFIIPFCSAVRARTNADMPITGCLYLVDISGFGIRQAWNLREYTQDISRILANSFPEVIDQIFVIGAPFYFSKIWACIKGWIDPGTASKLVFLSGPNVLQTLTERIGIQDIPETFGGKLHFEPGMPPVLDSKLKASLNWQATSHETFPPGPIKWVMNDHSQGMAVAVGSIGETLRYEPLAIFERLFDTQS